MANFSVPTPAPPIDDPVHVCICSCVCIQLKRQTEPVSPAWRVHGEGSWLPWRAGRGVAFRCVPYFWRLYIRLAYENIAFLCCIKRTLERRRLVSLFTRSMGEAGHFHSCGTRQEWEELGQHLVPPSLVILSLSCLHHWPASSQSLCPQVNALSKVRALPKRGPNWVRLSVD